MQSVTLRLLSHIPVRDRHELLAQALDPNGEHIYVASPSLVRAPGGAWVDFSRKEMLGRVLGCVLQTRDPGANPTVDADELIEAGWPDERMMYEAATNRLHQVISRLRRGGFKKVLEAHDGGYRIAPQFQVFREPAFAGLGVLGSAAKLADG